MNTWKIDPVHSEIKFKVRHLIVSTVTGQFKKFDAEIETPDDDFSKAKITFEAEVNSIDTNNADRDTHLKSEDFFDAANHPKMTFRSKSISKISDDKYKITGDMTMRGTTKEITLDVVYNGKAKGFDGIEVAGFEITGKLNRIEFGLKWNALIETGGLALSEEVKIEIFAEMKKVPVVHSGKSAA
jgi:polyisoprenoid-binding protein YceI